MKDAPIESMLSGKTAVNGHAIRAVFGYVRMVATLALVAAGMVLSGYISKDFAGWRETFPPQLHWLGWALVFLGLTLGVCSIFLAQRAFGPWSLERESGTPPPPDAGPRRLRPDSLTCSGVALRHCHEGDEKTWEFGGTPLGYALMIPLIFASVLGAGWLLLMLLLCLLGLALGKVSPSGWQSSFDGFATSSGVWFYITWFFLLPFNLPAPFARTRVHLGHDRLEWRRRGLVFQSTATAKLSEIQGIQPQGGAVFIRDALRGRHIVTPFTLNENEDLAWALTASITAARSKGGAVLPE